MNENSIDIEIKRSLFYPKKRLIINETSITYGDKSFLCANIRAVRYGTIQLYVNGIKASKTYEFGFLDNQGQTLSISFVSARTFGKDKRKEGVYENITNAIWGPVTSRILNEWVKELDSGRSVKVGKIEVTPAGISMRARKFFSSKVVFVPWNDCIKQAARGFLVLYSKEDKWRKCRLRFIKDWNCITLYCLLNYLWQDGRAYQLARKFSGAAPVISSSV